MVRGGCLDPWEGSLQLRVLLFLRSGLRESLLLLLVGVLQYHCVILWAVSTFILKAFIAASCHGVVLWFFQHRRVVIDPRFSSCRLALTENLCHFHTLVPFTCSDDFSLSLWSSSPASQCHSYAYATCNLSPLPILTVLNSGHLSGPL